MKKWLSQPLERLIIYFEEKVINIRENVKAPELSSIEIQYQEYSSVIQGHSHVNTHVVNEVYFRTTKTFSRFFIYPSNLNMAR